MKKLAAIALVLGALALAPASTNNGPAVLRSDELEEEIARTLHWGPPPTEEGHILLGPEDSVYIAPTQGDIEQMLKFYRARREGIPFLYQGFDCDNFAREFKHWADVWAVRFYSRTPAAVAVGMVYVKLSGDISDIFPGNHRYRATAYHVLGVILRDDGQFFWFEPQSSQLVKVESMLYEGTLEVLKVNL